MMTQEIRTRRYQQTGILCRVCICLLLLASLASCRQCRQVPCEQYETMSLYLNGNIPAGTDTLMLYRFANDGQFSHPVDSCLILPSPEDQLLYTAIDFRFDTLPSPGHEYDLQIVNPVDSRVLQVSAIQRTYLTHESCRGLFGISHPETACSNLLTSFSYAVNTGSVSTNGNTLYLLY